MQSERNTHRLQTAQAKIVNDRWEEDERTKTRKKYDTLTLLLRKTTSNRILKQYLSERKYTKLPNAAGQTY